MDSTILGGTDGGLVRSTNNGTNWANVGGGMSYSNVRALLSIASYPFDLVAGTVSGGTFMSSDTGRTFTGFPDASFQIGGIVTHVNSLLNIVGQSEFWAGTEKGVYLLPQYYPFSPWISYSDGLPSVETKVRAVIEKDGQIYAGTDGGVFKLNGSTWVEKNNGLTLTNVTALASMSGYLIAGAANGTGQGIYLSTDNGDTWTFSKSISSITSILAGGPNIFVGSFGDGIWLSKNYGSTWSQVNDGFGGAAYYVLSLGANSQYIYAGTNNANIWRRPLSEVITDPLPVELTSFNGAAKGKAVELKWTTATEVNNYGFEVERKTIDNGKLKIDNWNKLGFVEGNGTTNAPKEYSFSDSKIGTGRYSYRLKQIDRDGKFEYSQEVEVMVGSAPQKFDLAQNYPNPFNPTATIGFTLQTSGMTTLKVYDVIGREVATLVNEVKEAGYYSVTFDASKLSSGIYFAKLQSGDKVQLKKMLMIK